MEKAEGLLKSTLPGWDSALIPIWTLESPDAEVVAPAAPAATDLLSVLKERCPGKIQDTFPIPTRFYFYHL